MYAVVTTGGKQYRVEPGTTLSVEKLGVEPGGTVTFDRVLLIGDGDETTVGTPTVTGASVSATVLGDERGPKIVIFKFKQKVKYRRRTGHRQHLTRVRIDEITANGRSAKIEVEEAPKPTRRSRAAKAVAEPAGEATAPDARAETKAPTRPRRSRAAASASKATEPGEASEVTEVTEEKKAAPKRATTRRAAPRKKAEPEE